MFLTRQQYKALKNKRDNIKNDPYIRRYVKLSNSGIICDLYIVPFVMGHDMSFVNKLSKHDCRKFYRYIQHHNLLPIKKENMYYYAKERRLSCKSENNEQNNTS